MDPRYVGLSNSSKVGITPLEIMYEDLDESRAATVRTVFDHLGVRGDVPRRRSQVKRQADELNRAVCRAISASQNASRRGGCAWQVPEAHCVTTTSQRK